MFTPRGFEWAEGIVTNLITTTTKMEPVLLFIDHLLFGPWFAGRNMGSLWRPSPRGPSLSDLPLVFQGELLGLETLVSGPSSAP